ncbi:MAG: hypothetical protein KDK70_41800, partial [Myxococcales bacterium]|nr:hypothetical protein [Myxococcales bacterium]
ELLGEALQPHDERVQRALEVISSGGSWTADQRKWLERLAKQLAGQRVIDRSILDEDPAFASKGGFKSIDKEFAGELGALLRRLGEAVWQ